MKWRIVPNARVNYRIVRDDGSYVATFARQRDAERVVECRSACERFADPEKAIELLMAVARECADDDSGFLAATCLADPALQPPTGDAT